VSQKYKYTIHSERDNLWGLTVKSVGKQDIDPGQPYPPLGQNSKYFITPGQGRTLQEYQLIYITRGEGTFESASVKKTPVKAGDCFMLFPGEWHSYRPDPKTGWKEHWIGFEGKIVDEWVANGFFDKKSPIYHIGVNDEIIDLLIKAIEVATAQKICYQQLLAGYLSHILGLVATLSNLHELKSGNDVENKIELARIYIQESIEKEISIPEVADRIGMNYSSFRFAFKKYTGISPVQYKINLKLQKAMEMLYNLDLSVKDIAFSLNFESQEYFATIFKKVNGISPTDFRRQMTGTKR